MSLFISVRLVSILLERFAPFDIERIFLLKPALLNMILCQIIQNLNGTIKMVKLISRNIYYKLLLLKSIFVIVEKSTTNLIGL